MKTLANLGLSVLLAAAGAADAQAPPDPQVLSLMDQLKSGDWTQRTMAASMLGTLGEKAVPAIPLLLEPLEDVENTPLLYRTTVPITLGTIGPAAKAAIPALIKMLETENPDPENPDSRLWEQARANAAYALGAVGKADRARVLPVLAKAAKSPHPKIRDVAAAALTMLGEK